ncbi:MAG: GlsB/YeaQ/YmgE family stress response membrane protein [Chloroflexi bacterium]|nr:GlsB/YeaQ/YmgE family stress response membrane protein [Chloroflexota bacterium]
MDCVNVLVTALIGGVAGWLAGLLIQGRGFGAIGNIIIGLIGGVIGGVIVRFVNQNTNLDLTLPANWVGQIIVALIGAVALLFVLRLLFGGPRR